MIPRCFVCGSRDVTTKYFIPSKGRFFCSKECMLITNSARMILVGILACFIFSAGGIFFLMLVLIRDELILSILPAVWFGIDIFFGPIFIIRGIKGRNLSKTRGYEFEKTIYSCLFCDHEYKKRIYGGPTKCVNCGEESPFCDLCFNYIFSKHTVFQIQDCGHIFHKRELLDYLENKEICPKCRNQINSINLKIQKLGGEEL